VVSSRTDGGRGLVALRSLQTSTKTEAIKSTVDGTAQKKSFRLVDSVIFLDSKIARTTSVLLLFNGLLTFWSESELNVGARVSQSVEGCD
jgi:hypothetical protein